MGIWPKNEGSLALTLGRKIHLPSNHAQTTCESKWNLNCIWLSNMLTPVWSYVRCKVPIVGSKNWNFGKGNKKVPKSMFGSKFGLENVLGFDVFRISGGVDRFWGRGVEWRYFGKLKISLSGTIWKCVILGGSKSPKKVHFLAPGTPMFLE
jgi:hypothetical protein